MEEITRGVTGADLNSPWLTAGLVISPTQARIRCAPIATLVFSEVIAMRVLAYSEFGYFGFPELLAFGVPKLSIPQKLSNFLVRHTLPAPIGVGKKTLSLHLRL